MRLLDRIAKLSGAVVAICGFCVIAAMPAYADYTTVADSSAYGTIKDVVPVSSSLGGGDIPAGDYTDCTAQTSSKYFTLTVSSISVSDGAVTMYASMSSSYSAIALGTAEEVAASCSPEELGGGAYDVSGGAVFSMTIPGVNVPFEIAAYSVSKQVWYTRTICIDAGDGSQIAQAIIDAQQQADDPEPEPDPEPASDPVPSSTPATPSSQGSGGSTGGSGGTNQTASQANTTQPNAQQNTAQTQQQVVQTTKFDARNLRRLTMAGADAKNAAVVVETNSLVETFVDQNALAVRLVGAVCLILIAFGVALRVVLFQRQRK